MDPVAERPAPIARPPMKRPVISFCTHCHRRLWQLREVFEANLDAIELAGQEWCLLDYRSDDGLEAFVMARMAGRRWPRWFRYARLAGRVPYDMIRGKNLSAVMAHGALLFNLDADNQISTREIARLIEEFSDPAVAAVHNYSGKPKDGTFGRIAIRSRLFFQLNGYAEDLVGAAHHDRDLLRRAAVLGTVRSLRMEGPPAIPNAKSATIANLPGRLAREGYAAVRERNERMAARPQRLVPPIAPELAELLSPPESAAIATRHRIMLRAADPNAASACGATLSVSGITALEPKPSFAATRQAALGKAGILTLHDGANWGSMWQARELADWLGARVINLQHPQRKAACRAAASSHERKAFDRYAADSLPLSGPAKASASEDEWFEFINALQLDLLVVGGDETWKFAHPRSGKPGLRLSLPNGYWPDQRVRCTRVGFAICEGASDFDALPVEIRAEIARRLDTFELLCLRDRRTAEVIASLAPACADRIHLTPDPAWSSPPPSPEHIAAFRARIDSLRPAGGIVALSYGSVPRETLRRLQSEPAVRVVPFHHIPIASPGQFEALIAACDLLVTSRMHGLIAALRNGTAVAIAKPRPKVEEILRDSGLQSMTVDPGRTANGALAAQLRQWPQQEARAWAASCARRFAGVMEAVFGLTRPLRNP